jgi:hypothetical protein
VGGLRQAQDDSGSVQELVFRGFSVVSYEVRGPSTSSG